MNAKSHENSAFLHGHTHHWQRAQHSLTGLLDPRTAR